MYMNEEELQILTRIAVALESIADSLEKNPPKTSDVNTSQNVVSEENTISHPIYKREEIDVNILIDKLKDNNITVKTYVDKEDENTSMDYISKFMGMRYSDIKTVYEAMKHHLNKPHGFHLDLKNASQNEISASCQLCNNLYQIAFLSEYKYDKSPKYFIHATPNKIPIAINFLTGHWLEIFIRRIVQESLQSLPTDIEYTYLINPQITLPNGDDFELDVVFLINGQIYWFEGKTGNYQHYINKYSEVESLMGLDKQYSFMVLTDVPHSNTAYILSKTFGMSIISVEDFKEEINYVLRENLDLPLNG